MNIEKIKEFPTIRRRKENVEKFKKEILLPILNDWENFDDTKIKDYMIWITNYDKTVSSSCGIGNNYHNGERIEEFIVVFPEKSYIVRKTTKKDWGCDVWDGCWKRFNDKYSYKEIQYDKHILVGVDYEYEWDARAQLGGSYKSFCKKEIIPFGTTYQNLENVDTYYVSLIIRNSLMKRSLLTYSIRLNKYDIDKICDLLILLPDYFNTYYGSKFKYLHYNDKFNDISEVNDINKLFRK